MVKRKISVEHYLKVGFLTILVFSLGISLGLLIDNERVDWLRAEGQQQEVMYQGLQLQYIFISELEQDKEICPVLEATLEDSIADLGHTLDTLEEYQKNTQVNKEEYELIKHRYILDNLRYWMFVKKTKAVCEKDLVTVLYFYSQDKCDICPDMGVMLTYFKKIFDDRLLIFPINVDLEKDEPMIKIIRTRYGVTEFPSIVIEDNMHAGLLSKDTLGNELCNAFETEQPECKTQ